MIRQWSVSRLYHTKIIRYPHLNSHEVSNCAHCDSMQAKKNRTKKVFVGGVPTDMEKNTIDEYFAQFGEVGTIHRSLHSLDVPLHRLKRSL